MSLAGRVADREAALLAPERTEARTNRPDRQPGSHSPGAAQPGSNARARAGEQRLDGLTRCDARSRSARLAEPIPADAARERESAVVGDHHAAVAAVEGEHRQQSRRELRAREVRFEREQVRRPRLGPRPLLRRERRLPRAVRVDDDPCFEHGCARRISRQVHGARVPAVASRDVDGGPGCQISTPSAAARDSSSASSRSRPSARPQGLVAPRSFGSSAHNASPPA